MLFKFGATVAILAFASSTFASEIFVREARGNLTQRQRAEITGLVKNAVRNMSEHTLVGQASKADFILQPSVVSRGDELVLRVEKSRNGEILAMSEESINGVNASKDRAMSVTETALSDVNYGHAWSTDDDNDTASATSVSAEDIDSSSADSSADRSTDSSTASRDTARDTSASATRSSTRDSARDAARDTGSRAIDVSDDTTRTRQDNSSTYQTTGVDSTAKSPGADASVGELTAASPRMLDPNRVGQVQLGVGPSVGINMKTDSVMYDLMAAYAVDFNENFVGKVFGDFNLSSGSDVAHFINLGFAGEYYPSKEYLTFGKPYFAADLGYAFARDNLNRTGEGLAGGLGAGFKFQAAQLNWDVAANYTILFSQIADATPQVFGIRVALGF